MRSQFRSKAGANAALCIIIAIFAGSAIPALVDANMPADVMAASGLLLVALIALSIFDLRTMRLPDAMTLPLIAAGLALTVAFDWGKPLWHLLAAIAGYLVLFAVAEAYHAVRKRSGLGLGDAKLFAAAGAWLGPAGLPSVMLWATVFALLGVIAASVAGRPLSGTSPVPFGPFIAFGFWLVWLYGPLT